MERTTFCLPRKFSNVVSCLTQGAFMCPCVSHWMFICAYRVNFSKSYNFTLQHISRCKSTQQKALQNFAVVAWRYSIILRCSRVLYFTYSKHRPLLSLCKLMSSPFKEFRNNIEMLLLLEGIVSFYDVILYPSKSSNGWNKTP